MRAAGAVGAAFIAVVAAGCATDDDASPEVSRTPTSSTSAVPAPSPTPVSPLAAHQLGLRSVAALKRDEPARAIELIERGADVNAQDSLEDSVFLYAGAEGYADVVRVALAHGADTRVLNRYGGTALIPASEHAHLEVIRILLTSDIDVNHVNEPGWTALQEAILLGDGGPRQQAAVRLLLAGGADPGIRDKRRRTALENARRLGFDEIAAIIARR